MTIDVRPNIFQTMAECDCPRQSECLKADRCLAVEPPPILSRQRQRDMVGLEVAALYASLGTCARRKVGALITDDRGRPLSVGYNGPPSGRPHCTDTPCPGAGFPSGQGLEECEAIHAEQNAILHLFDRQRAHTIYVTAFPCHSCIKLLLGTPIRRIVYREAYPHKQSYAWWTEQGRELIQIPHEANTDI